MTGKLRYLLWYENLSFDVTVCQQQVHWKRPITYIPALMARWARHYSLADIIIAEWKAGHTFGFSLPHKKGYWRNPSRQDIVFWQHAPLLSECADQHLELVDCSRWSILNVPTCLFDRSRSNSQLLSGGNSHTLIKICLVPAEQVKFQSVYGHLSLQLRKNVKLTWPVIVKHGSHFLPCLAL